MTGQCKHCSHFCTGRIGSVVSLEWSLKLQGCYLGGMLVDPHRNLSLATPSNHWYCVLLNSERTQKPEQHAVVAVFWCLAWLGCSVLPSLSTSTARWLFCSSFSSLTWDHAKQKKTFSGLFRPWEARLTLALAFPFWLRCQWRRPHFLALSQLYLGEEARTASHNTNGSFRVNCTCTSIDV